MRVVPKQLASALDGPYFSFLRVVQTSVSDLVGPDGSMDDAETSRRVVAEIVHRMVFVRSTLLSRQLLADGSSIDGYDARSEAARILGPHEQVPEGWVLHEQGLTNAEEAATTVFIAYDPTRVAEPLVSNIAPHFDTLELLYERGVRRVEGDVDCRVFAAPCGGPIQAAEVLAEAPEAPATQRRETMSVVEDIGL